MTPTATAVLPVWSLPGQTGLCVSGGMIERPPEGDMEERCHQGLKLVLLLEGSLRCELPEVGMQTISGPSLCAIMDGGNHVAVQRFETEQRLRYVMLVMDRDALPSLIGADLGELAARAGASSLRHGPLLMRYMPTPQLRRLALQLMTLPVRAGAGGRLYAQGKSLEFAGLAVDHLAGIANDDTCIMDIRPNERERLHAARDLLAARLDGAPDMANLARQTGLNIRKLTEGFRVLFGATPAAWLQAQRLDTAHRRIADGEWTVSQAAGNVGYTPAAFATAFRRRFGIAPSTLRR